MHRGILQPLTKNSTVSVLCHVWLGCAGWICDEKCVRKENSLIIFTDNSLTHSEKLWTFIAQMMLDWHEANIVGGQDVLVQLVIDLARIWVLHRYSGLQTTLLD